MKRMLSFLCAMVICLALFPAEAAGALYSIQQLSSATAPAWQQTYQAHGRTIQANVTIDIPQVPAAPVLTVQAASPIPEPLNSQLTAWYQQALKDDQVNRYSFSSTNYRTALTHAVPPAWGETRNSEFVAGAMSAQSTDLYEYDENAAYAEDSPLTVAGAISIATQHASELFPAMAFSLRNVYTTGRSFWKDSHQPISAQGHYTMLFAQVFHGIPFAASIHEAFTQFAIGNENSWLSQRGIMRASIYDAQAWGLSCILYQETGTLHADIPLLPFDEVKSQVEALILSGHVRWVDSVSLGYVQFDTDDPEEQVLVPCWVVWCEFHPDGAESEQENGENSNASLMYDGNNSYYRPLIFNAQTGHMVDPESEAEGRCLCPDILIW